MSPLYTTLVHDQGHHPTFPTDPDHPQPLILHITLTMRPLILGAVGAALSLLQLREYLKNIGAEFGSEGSELEEVSELPLEEVEVVKIEFKRLSCTKKENSGRAVGLASSLGLLQKRK